MQKALSAAPALIVSADGDLYNVLRYRDLMPKGAHVPADYAAVPPKRLDRPCVFNDVADHFLNYLLNDLTAKIATTHLCLADGEEGTRSIECLKLAELHSRAVDFQKSGVPVDHRELPRAPRLRPDYLQPVGELSLAQEERFYRSKRVLGQLFRAIDLPPEPARRVSRSLTRFDREGSVCNAVPSRARGTASSLVIETAILFELEKLNFYLSTSDDDDAIAKELFNTYVIELEQICANNSLSRRHDRGLTEHEAFCGLITLAVLQKRKRDDAASKLRDQVRKRFSMTSRRLSFILQTTILADGVLAELKLKKTDAWLNRSFAAWRAGVTIAPAFGGATFSYLALLSVMEAICALRGEARDLAEEAEAI